MQPPIGLNTSKTQNYVAVATVSICIRLIPIYIQEIFDSHSLYPYFHLYYNG